MSKLKLFLITITFLVIIYFTFPYFLDVKISQIPESKLIYDQNNIEIGEIIADKKYRHINFLNYPEFLKKSLVAIEDKRFFYHDGIDYIGILRALKNNITNYSTQGASTIENQIIRNNNWLNEKRTIFLKLKEFLYSKGLNAKYSKDEILNIYLNNVNFGYLTFGFESASKFYYSKSSPKLTKAEIIGLITIIKNSNIYNPITNRPQFDKRFKTIVNSLEKSKVISPQEKTQILSEKLNFQKNNFQKLPYISDFIKSQNISTIGNINTTIDYYLTNKIEEIAKESLKKLAWKNVGDYGILIVDRKTHELKVMIGGVNYNYENGQVNSTLALRQPGSTLKPFIYLLSFRDLNKTPSSTILDLPVQFPTNDGNVYAPQNYSLTFGGEVSLAESLSQSINVPAIKLLNEVGINKFLIFLKTLGINTLNKSSDFYGLSIGLGSGEVSLFELLKSYTLFANDGSVCDIVFVKGQNPNCKKIVDKKYTDMVYDILTNRFFKLAGFPINSNLDFADKEVFLKTGTSRNFKDNWTIGFTRDYMIGVWVGNKDGQEMKGVSGADGAGDIFRKIVYSLDEKSFENKAKNIEKISEIYQKIISPLDKSVFKFDKSIPLENQQIKLEFSTNLDFDQANWYFNNSLYTKDFISINLLKKENTLKLELLKDGKIIGTDISNIGLGE